MKKMALSLLFIISIAFSQNNAEDWENDKTLLPSDQEKKIAASDNLAVSTDNIITLAVLDFGGHNIDSTSTITLANRFRAELMKTEKYGVMERTEMHKILQEQNFQRSDCVDQTCAVEAGQLIAVKKIVTGTIAKIGAIYTVNIKLLDVATGKIDKNVSEDCDCPIEKVLMETMKNLAFQMAGITSEKKDRKIAIQRGDASLFVKTDPEDASVYFDGKLMDGRTPVSLENLTPGRHTILVKKADLRANRVVELKSNEVTRIALKLEKQKTVLNVSSTPTEAEVLLDHTRLTLSKSGQKTPAIFYNISAGKHQFFLFKVGYADTLLSIDVKEFETNEYTINLRTITDEKQIYAQKKFVKHRIQRKAGRVMIFGSFGLAAAGGILTYLAQKDYDDAMDAKTTLQNSSITSGPEYEALVKENKDKSDSGDLKTYIGAGLFGAAGACGALGLIFYF